jgi:ribosomal-protein-alanine N-acetyltransferase
LTTWESPSNIQDTIDWIGGIQASQSKGHPVPWGGVLKSNGRYVGTAGYASWEPDHARAEFGYSFARDCWGQGLATEAAVAILDFGFKAIGLNRIEAKCMVENGASERVLLKAGMTLDALLPEYWMKNGNPHDVKVYSCLRRM